MKIKWMGHACFLMDASKGMLLTDPYDNSLPYCNLDVEPDVITVSHDHFDHNAVGRVAGKPKVVRGAGETKAIGTVFRGIATYHDENQGKDRGKNTIFTFKLEGISIAHLGDLGHQLDDKQLQALLPTEVLLVPVGGNFTIGPDEAMALVKKLPKLKIVIPMHYKTDKLGDDFPIAPVDDFINKAERIDWKNSSEVVINGKSLPTKREVWILHYAKDL